MRQRELKWLAQTQSWSFGMKILPKWPDFTSHTGCIGGIQWDARNFGGQWMCSLSWLGWWFPMCICINTLSCSCCLIVKEKKERESCSVVSDSLRPHGLYSPWNSQGQNTGVGSLSLLQKIFPTQGSNPGLPHCRWILYQLSHKGSPRILEWVAYPFSSGSS